MTALVHYAPRSAPSLCGEAGTTANRAKTNCPNCLRLIAEAAQRAKPTKLSLLRAAAERGDWPRALAYAATFPDLGDAETARTIRNGHEATKRPDFFRQLGRDPAKVQAAGIEALRRRYSIA